MTRVLLFSGGLDSYIAAHLWRADVLLYCRLGHRYQQHETDAVRRTGLPVRYDDRLSLRDLERDDAIIPLRNLYLLAIASHYGNTLALGALQGEVNGDKTEAFREQTEALLNTCYARSYWSHGDPVTIEFPIAEFTKAELVARYLADGGKPHTLTAKTRSCYSRAALPCGTCSACVKRYIAMTLNGIHEPLAYDPHRSKYVRTIRERWHTFDAKRQQETAAVFPEATGI